MRFIHTADLHIDSPLRGLSRYQGAPLERLRSATRRALERLVELAVDEKVDFVLMAGDLYDRDWQDFHTGLFVNAQLVKLKNAGIQVFIVQGNHDAQSHMTRQIPWPDNVKVFSSRTAETAHLKALGVAIHGHSFPNREVPENLVPGYPPALPGCFNIGLLHTSLTGIGRPRHLRAGHPVRPQGQGLRLLGAGPCPRPAGGVRSAARGLSGQPAGPPRARDRPQGLRTGDGRRRSAHGALRAAGRGALASGGN